MDDDGRVVVETVAVGTPSGPLLDTHAYTHLTPRIDTTRLDADMERATSVKIKGIVLRYLSK